MHAVMTSHACTCCRLAACTQCSCAEPTASWLMLPECQAASWPGSSSRPPARRVQQTRELQRVLAVQEQGTLAAPHFRRRSRLLDSHPHKLPVNPHINAAEIVGQLAGDPAVLYCLHWRASGMYITHICTLPFRPLSLVLWLHFIAELLAERCLLQVVHRRLGNVDQGLLG